MKSNDIRTREEIRAAMQKAISENNTESFYTAFDELLGRIETDLKQDYETQLEGVRQEADARVLTARGVRQLTTKEKEFYQKFGEAISSANPQQALTDLDAVLPETTIDAVFEELETRHPLLSKIKFIATKAKVKLLLNTHASQAAAWGTLTAAISQEMTSGFKEVNSDLYKLSAYIPIAKSMLDLGPEWLDRYVRTALYEMLATGLENGIVNGTGKDQPIGMNRQVGDDVTVTAGVYPLKTAQTVNNLKPATVGTILGTLAIDGKGGSRVVDDIIFLCNPVDYHTKVMPATTVMAPDGTYRNNVMPYPMTVIPTAALDRGKAIIGLAGRYLATAGMESGGKIDYSDHAKFIEDQRAYIIKTYANGFALDNNAFMYLDISSLEPLHYEFAQIDATAKSTDATLAVLNVGDKTLTPAFAASTTWYTLDTTDTKNVVTAISAHVGATVEVKLGTVV